MEKKKIKIIISSFIFFCILIGAAISYRAARTQSVYDGLPTVPCIDATKPVVQSYSLFITIYIANKKYLLSPAIGHDAGNCLHSIFTNDNSGTVFVRTNTLEPLTLGQFFNTWKATFNAQQIFQYQADNNHHIKVFVNNKLVDTYEHTILQENQKIIIFYN